jgi:hypothetical protein
VRIRFTIPVALFLLLACALSLRAQDQASNAPAIPGQWRGAWYIGMTSGIITLTLSAEPLRGSMQLTNHEKLGAEPIELKDLVLEGDTLTFRAVGEDGAPLRAKLQIAGDQMKGFAQHAGLAMRMEPARIARRE